MRETSPEQEGIGAVGELKEAGGREALRPRKGLGGGAFVARDGVLGFAFTDYGQPGFTGGAGVLNHLLGGGAGEDLAALCLAVY
jgi:hypothetical protein